MPFIHVKLAAVDLGAGQIAAIQQGVTSLMVEVLRKRAEVTAVLVEAAPLEGWTFGAKTAACAAHIDAKVTEGTNTAEEKSRFVAEAHALLRRVLGPGLPEATYVVVHEVRAESWGYDGVTQESRAITRAKAA